MLFFDDVLLNMDLGEFLLKSDEVDYIKFYVYFNQFNEENIHLFYFAVLFAEDCAHFDFEGYCETHYFSIHWGSARTCN